MAPFVQVLKLRGDFHSLPDSARHALQSLAVGETQRALAARGQASEVASIAQRRGWRVVVLKGGAAAALGRAPVDLHDLDLLVEPSNAPELAAALRACGYVASGWSSPQHLTGLHAPHQLPIELHVSLDPFGAATPATVWQRAQPIEGMPPLERLAPIDQAWHLLVHICIQHPGRHGVLRDLLLIRDACEECSPEAAADLSVRMLGHDHEVVLNRLLEASSFERRHANDLFLRDRAQALATGTLAARLPGPPLFRGDTANWALALLRGVPALHYCWKRLSWRTVDPSAARAIAWVERHSPRLGRVVRVASRSLRLATAFVVALPLAAAAWWLIRSVVRELVAERVEEESGEFSAVERIQADSEAEARPAGGRGE